METAVSTLAAALQHSFRLYNEVLFLLLSMAVALISTIYAANMLAAASTDTSKLQFHWETSLGHASA